MRKANREAENALAQMLRGRLAAPTDRYRRQAWRAFQRALDPLGPHKQLPSRRR